MTFNRQLRTLRTAKKLSQTAVAEAIGVARVEISRWEQGKTYPTEEKIEKLCELFSVPREFLIGEQPEAIDPRERSIFDKIHQLNSQNKQRVDYYLSDLLVVQKGEQKLEAQELPIRAEARKLNGGIRCSFCGRPQNLCDHLIAGNNSYICDECVKLCTEVLQDERYKKDEG